ncbi:VOC family protein [Longispora albida]|uniref:VOC family protein n=1 Tax=Longispora albida TaxID=203523 RepID=UPI000361165E|nr:VOC family protein [Longispora albida]
MATSNIFVNLPVKDLDQTIAFWTKLGYSFNKQFTDEKAGCLVIADNIYAMLITEDFFSTFTTRAIADASKVAEVIIALSADTREEVDQIADAALASGGSAAQDPMDHGFMYVRSFTDPDGHMWEILYMDPSHVE